MDETLHSLTALGAAAPEIHEIGRYRIAERFDVALASLATRKGQDAAFERAAGDLGLPLPTPARWEQGAVFAAFWVSPGMWMIEAPFSTHEDIVASLKPVFAGAASITEQTDAWVRFDLSAPDLAPLLERLSNIDFASAQDGYASRTVIEHTGCYLIRRNPGDVTLYGPRSSARSLLHAVTVAAASIL